MVTESRLRRKRIAKVQKIAKWKRSTALAEEFKKVYDSWASTKRAEIKQRKASKVSPPAEKAPEVKAPVKKVEKVEKKAEVKKTEVKKVAQAKVAEKAKPKA